MENFRIKFLKNKISYCEIKKIRFDNINEVIDLYDLSELNTMVGNFEISINILKRISSLNPNWIDINDFIARNYWALHDYSTARNYWKFFDELRSDKLKKLCISNINTIDEVWTQSFGNFAKLFSVLELNENNTQFFWHSEKDNALISNKLLHKIFSEKIKKQKPLELTEAIKHDNYISRYPFYCIKDVNNEFSHFKYSWNSKMIKLSSENKRIKINFDFFASYAEILKQANFKYKNKFVVIHARESGYWNRIGNKMHSTKNSNILDYIPAIKFLISQGYQVVRIGDKSMTKLPEIANLIDYAHLDIKNDFLDIFFIRYCEFMITSTSGPNEVAGTLMTPVLAVNWFPVHAVPYSSFDLVLLKTVRNKLNGRKLSFDELYKLPYAEFSYYMLEQYGYEVIENTSDEILYATKKMQGKVENSHKNSFNFSKYNISSEAEIINI